MTNILYKKKKNKYNFIGNGFSIDSINIFFLIFLSHNLRFLWRHGFDSVAEQT
jgi:hypothetical protein